MPFKVYGWPLNLLDGQIWLIFLNEVSPWANGLTRDGRDAYTVNKNK